MAVVTTKPLVKTPAKPLVKPAVKVIKAQVKTVIRPALPKVILPTEPTFMAQQAKDHVMLFYGPPGVGKTTFVNQLAARVFFFSTDRGTRGQRTMREECTSWTKFLATLAALEQPGAPQYDIACIDHVDDMASMADAAVCAKLGVDSLGDESLGWGKGWKFFKNEMQSFVRRLSALNMGVCFISHEELKVIKTRAIELNRTMPAMPKSAWKVIIPMADIVGYCGFKTVKVKTDAGETRREVRILETIPREDLYVKDRTRRNKPLSGWEFLDGSKFISTFSAVKK